MNRFCLSQCWWLVGDFMTIVFPASRLINIPRGNLGDIPRYRWAVVSPD